MRYLLIRACDAVYTNYRIMVYLWNAFYDALESSALGSNYARVICYDASVYAYAPKTVLVHNANFLWLCLMWFLRFVLLLHVDAFLQHRYVERMRRHLDENVAPHDRSWIYEYHTTSRDGGPFLCRRPVMHPHLDPPPATEDAEEPRVVILSARVGGNRADETFSACVTGRLQALVTRTEDTFTATELAMVLTGGTVRFPKNLMVVWEYGGDFCERTFLANDVVCLHVAENLDDLD